MGSTFNVFIFILFSFSIIFLSCSTSKGLKGDEETLAKNFIEGAINSIRRSELADAEIHLLKAELILGAHPVVEQLKSEVRKLARTNRSSVDTVLSCELAGNCYEILQRLQAKFCNSRELFNDEYPIFVYLGGRVLDTESTCDNKTFKQLLAYLVDNIEYFDFSLERDSPNLSNTEKKILNLARAFKVEGRRELFNNLPNDLLIFLLSR